MQPPYIDVEITVQAVPQDELVGHGYALRLHGVVRSVIVARVVIWHEGKRQDTARRGQGRRRAAGVEAGGLQRQFWSSVPGRKHAQSSKWYSKSVKAWPEASSKQLATGPCSLS